jgi:hypothetical protein
MTCLSSVSSLVVVCGSHLALLFVVVSLERPRERKNNCGNCVYLFYGLTLMCDPSLLIVSKCTCVLGYLPLHLFSYFQLIFNTGTTTFFTFCNNQKPWLKAQKPLPKCISNGFPGVGYTAVAYSNRQRFFHFSPRNTKTVAQLWKRRRFSHPVKATVCF